MLINSFSLYHFVKVYHCFLCILTVCLIEMFQDGGEPEADEAASANAADPDNPDPQPTEPRSFTSTRHARVPCPNSSPFQDSQTQM